MSLKLSQYFGLANKIYPSKIDIKFFTLIITINNSTSNVT